MKKMLSIFSILFVVALAANAQQTRWVIDKAHTNILFTISHMVISDVSGQFHDYEAEILADKPDFSDLKINISIDVKSIDTDNAKRDDHLRSADFFDVAKYPEMTFISKTMKKTGDKTYQLTGDFTMHGITKEITLDVKYSGTITDPWGNTRAGFKLTGSLNRGDFGLKYNSVMDNGGLLIGEEVNIICNVEIVKAK
ncbi:MAG TPA: polyisoprenoid-binding protein [Caldithrix abyssi]|uniref:Polyisoprenoid-binding protein n=1 Tax=Caldithrix abyssi TaxID=187145 RepID=A0A7V4WV09_CALAY|nr:polyisoprenoid-binding protein [Caldithrix abyssi]